MKENEGKSSNKNSKKAKEKEKVNKEEIKMIKNKKLRNIEEKITTIT